MALQRTRLADIQTLPATAGSVYANPASTKTYVRAVTLHNTGASAETVRLHNVPDASGSLGTPGAGNRFLSVSLPAGDTLIIEWAYPIVLIDTNDAIFGSADTASTVTIMLHGDKE